MDLGYLDVPEGEWGYFGRKTQAAVNAYKEDHDLGNDGEYHGVVGKETWQSLGLLCREQKDIDAGVEIVTIDGKQYFDITVPLMKQLNEVTQTAQILRYAPLYISSAWFISKVAPKQSWDIKHPPSWKKTLKTTFPGGPNEPVVVNGEVYTTQELGNITYGYIGAALGYTLPLLYTGSFVAALPKNERDLLNEMTDRPMIQKGYELYHS